MNFVHSHLPSSSAILKSTDVVSVLIQCCSSYRHLSFLLGLFFALWTIFINLHSFQL